MIDRLKLHQLLCDKLESNHVYFQPPEGMKIVYPAIVYSLGNIVLHKANNGQYFRDNVYTVTLMDKNPESETVDRLLTIPTCNFNRSYVYDGLNHWTFTVY